MTISKRTIPLYFSIFLLCILLVGCVHSPTKPDSPKEESEINKLPNKKLVDELPVFAEEDNEVQISDSFNNIDPNFVLGSLVLLREGNKGQVKSFNNFLKNGVRSKTILLTEIVFKNFVEDSLVANADWLSFVKSELKNNIKAEVTIIKTSSVNIHPDDIDHSKLSNFASALNKQERDRYGVIIGYIDFALTASLFKDNSASGEIGGYGAKIGGTWYSKVEDTSAQHRLVAVWAPLPLVIKAVKRDANVTATFDTTEAKPTLNEEVKEMLNNKSLRLEKLYYIEILKTPK